MRIAAGVLGLLCLAGCAATPPPPEPEPPVDRYVGTTRWVNSKYQVSVCDAPHDYSKPTPSCRPAKTGTALTIQRAVFVYKYDIPIQNGYAVSGEGGVSGFIRQTDAIMMSDERERKRQASDKADCDRRGGVRVGMTRAQIFASCWGQPKSTNETLTARGKHEQMVYGGGYLYLEDGILTSIQTSH